MISSLCVFGDSVTKGVVFDSAMRKYIFLKDCFVNLFSGSTGIRVDNYSKFGCTLKKGTEIVKKHSEDLPKYDYIALEFGGNDCNFKWDEIAADPKSEHLPQTPISDFKKLYRSLIDGIRSLGGRPLLLNLPPLDAKRFFDWISVGLCSQNILQWLGEVDVIFRWQETYSKTVCDLAEETGVPLIDIRSLFFEYGDYSALLCEDGMHPNKLGHKLISDTIRGFAA